MGQQYIDDIWGSTGTVTDPGAVKANLGWVAEIPPFEYQNWHMNRADLWMEYVQQSGIEAWHASVSYQDEGVTRGSDGVLYQSQIASNVGNDPTSDSGANWRRLRTDPVSTIGGSVYGLEIELDTDADHDIKINPGACPAANGYLNAAITKRLDDAFVAGDGNGGLKDGGSDTPAVDETYHVHMIRLNSNGDIDVYFDPSPSAANIPAGYSHVCRITSMYTDGSANWITFTNSGDEFRLGSVVTNASTDPGTSAVTPTLPVPTDIQVLAHLTVALEDSWVAVPTIRRALVTSMDQADVAVGSANYTLHTHCSNAFAEDVVVSMTDKLLTDTLGRFRFRLFSSASVVTVLWIVSGWTDHRRGLS